MTHHGAREAGCRAIRLEETEWLERAYRFIQEHPGSTLISLMQNLCPGFFLLPEERRAQYWSWLEADFETLSARGPLYWRIGEDGVRRWFVRVISDQAHHEAWWEQAA
jgi:hypothetical protein